jgi:5'-nucleotidase
MERVLKYIVLMGLVAMCFSFAIVFSMTASNWRDGALAVSIFATGCSFAVTLHTELKKDWVKNERTIILGMDIDGVLSDLQSEWLLRYNRDYKDNLQESDIIEWDMVKAVLPECGKNIYRYLSDSDLYECVKPYDESLRFINRLREIKHKNGKPKYRIVFITSVAGDHGGQKLKWLRKHGFLPDGILTDDYVECTDKATLMNVDIMVDDYDVTIDKFVDARRGAILLSRPWNYHYSNASKLFSRASSYNEIVYLLS